MRDFFIGGKCYAGATAQHLKGAPVPTYYSVVVAFRTYARGCTTNTNFRDPDRLMQNRVKQKLKYIAFRI